MRYLVQVVSVLAVAIGVGMLVAGGTARPRLEFNSPQNGPVHVSISGGDVEFLHYLAVGLKGFGAGFLTLGLFGLALPWINIALECLHRAQSPGTKFPLTQNSA